MRTVRLALVAFCCGFALLMSGCTGEHSTTWIVSENVVDHLLYRTPLAGEDVEWLETVNHTVRKSPRQHYDSTATFSVSVSVDSSVNDERFVPVITGDSIGVDVVRIQYHVIGNGWRMLLVRHDDHSRKYLLIGSWDSRQGEKRVQRVLEEVGLTRR